MLPGGHGARTSARVFARMILALLLLAFAFPALANAPCHDAPLAPLAMAMTHAGHQAPHHGVPASDERGVVPHMCIGCIPPASIAPRPMTAPVAYGAVRRAIVASAFPAGLSAPPILPPPRPTV
ncbi:hypothetical protein [Sphingomonas sp. PvP055]|uniref:hypothetical protein n=1 Tax=Sphingomonas sp. PvP055 TaxID=3156391 RepID=UPI003393A7CB